MPTRPIVVIGSLNADFVVEVERFPRPGETLVSRDLKMFPGGKGANQAYGAARLGASVSMLGQVGDDAQGRWLKDHLAGAGVDVASVREESGVSSGVAFILLDASGQNQIIIVAGANGTFTPDRLPSSPAVFNNAIVLLQLETPIETVTEAARRARGAGATVILDPAPARPLPDELLASIDYVTPNETELAALCGLPVELTLEELLKAARSLLDRGVRTVIVKMGERGAALVARDRQLAWAPHKVAAVDTTAAGDAFNAAYAAALARGAADDEAGRFACAAAAVSVTRPGAQPSMPTHEEVHTMIERHAVRLQTR